MENDKLLMIFIQNPLTGKVKTRIAEYIGESKAVEIYMQLLAHTLKVTYPLGCDKVVFYSDFIELNDVWKKSGYIQHIQEGNDTGAVLTNAFNKVFEKKYKSVVAIDSDCYDLTSEILEEAFDALDENEIVIGPSYDGGYYLLGTNSNHPEFFKNKKWGSPDVFLDTIIDIQALKVPYKILHTLRDIDTIDDVQMYEDLFGGI